MKNLFRILRDWQGLWAAFAFLILFTAIPIEKIFPTDAGIVPGAFLQALILWQGVFFLGIAMSWVAFQCDFREIDRELDAGHLASWFHSLTPERKIGVSLLLFSFFVLWQAVSLCLVVSLLS